MSTRALLLGALLCPLVALLTIGALVMTFSPATAVVETNVWPQSVDLAESLHTEAILAAQLEAAEGSASRTALEERRLRTDELLDRWSSTGTASGQIEAQLEAIRIVDESRDVPEAQELLQLADAVRQEAADASPQVAGVAELVLAARSDASLAVQGSGVATLTTTAKAQRTRIDGMTTVNNTVLDGSMPPGSAALESVLDDTSELHTALIAGDAVTIGQWTDGHLERQRAIAEVARVQAVAGVREAPAANAFPTSAALAAAIAGLFALLVFGGVVFRRLNAGARELEDQMLRFATQTLPNNMAAADSERVPLGEQIEPVAMSGDLQGVAHAFNKVQESTAYIVDEQRSTNTFVIDRVFQSLAERNRTSIDEQRLIVDELVHSESDLGTLEQLAQLNTRLRRMERDVVSLGALGGEASPVLFGDLALSEIVDRAVEETHSADRVRLVPVDDVLVDASCAADVAHVVTELLENALHSSPPESIVEVMGNHTDRGSLVLSIADEGLGMDADEMEGLNRELASYSELKPETAGTLGVVAISAIAERSGIDVRFTDSPSAGVTALVTVPAESIRSLPDDWMSEADQHEAFATVDDVVVDAAGHGVDDAAGHGVDDVVDESDEPDEHLVSLREVPNPADEPAGEPLVEARSFDRDLPVAEFEYDLDAEVSAPSMAPEFDDAADIEGFGLGIIDDDEVDVEEELTPNFALDSADEIPLSEIDYDTSPFEAATDDQLEQRSGTELLKPMNRRTKEPAPHFGPKKRAKRNAEESPSPIEDVDTSDDHANTSGSADEVADSVEIERDEAREVADDAEAYMGSVSDGAEDDEQADETVAVPRAISEDDAVEPGPTYGVAASNDEDSSTTYVALGSLLANLPERVEDIPVEPAVVAKSGVARRIPTASSSVPPSQLGISVPERPKSEPKTPEDIRKLLAKYRASDEG